MSCWCGGVQGLTCVVWPAVSAQYIQSMLLQRGSKTALLPLPVDVGLTAASKLGSCMLEFAVILTGTPHTKSLVQDRNSVSSSQDLSCPSVILLGNSRAAFCGTSHSSHMPCEYPEIVQ